MDHCEDDFPQPVAVAVGLSDGVRPPVRIPVKHFDHRIPKEMKTGNSMGRFVDSDAPTHRLRYVVEVDNWFCRFCSSRLVPYPLLDFAHTSTAPSTNPFPQRSL